MHFFGGGVIRMAKKMDAQKVKTNFYGIIRSLLDLVQSASEETIHLPLEACVSIFQIDKEIASEFQADLLPIFMDLWGQYHHDPLLSSTFSDIFKTLASSENHENRLAFLHAVIPTLLSIIQSTHTPQPMLEV